MDIFSADFHYFINNIIDAKEPEYRKKSMRACNFFRSDLFSSHEQNLLKSLFKMSQIAKCLYIIASYLRVAMFKNSY